MSGAGAAQIDEFERFVRATERSLYGHAYLLCGQYQEAQDLVQESFVQAWRHWGRVSSYDDPRAWTRRVITNLAISRWRRTRAWGARQDRSGGGVALWSDPPDVGHLDVARALARLPTRQRVAVVLHDLSDLSVAEVAREMRVPEGSVRGWLSRARATLATELGIELVKPGKGAR